MAKHTKKESIGPSLEELVERATPIEEKSDSIQNLGATPYRITPKHAQPTLRLKFYWFLRALIDWIHP